MAIEKLLQQISEFLGFNIPKTPVSFITLDAFEKQGYRSVHINYSEWYQVHL
jgi:hypothetical protein